MGQVKKIAFIDDGAETTFVSGVFNILHPGHRRFLDFAASQNKKLIIGVLSDKLAGDKAYMPEDVRLAAVKAYSKLAHVILITSDLKKVLSDYRPNLVIKGPEYKEQTNDEDVIKTWGVLIFSAGNEKSGATMEFVTLNFRFLGKQRNK